MNPVPLSRHNYVTVGILLREFLARLYAHTLGDKATSQEILLKFSVLESELLHSCVS